jgi:hypothetical protein
MAFCSLNRNNEDYAFVAITVILPRQLSQPLPVSA